MPDRILLTLPAIPPGSTPWQLPLCDATAMSLACVLVDDDTAIRQGRLMAALMADPALAVWGVWCAAGQSSQPTVRGAPPNIRALVEWLSPRLVDLLRWPGARPIAAFSPDMQGRFAAFVAESVGVAHEAVRSTNREELIQQPIYLAALTTRWQEWIAAVAPDVDIRTVAWPLEPAPLPASTSSLSAESRAAADEAWRRWLTDMPGVQTLLPPLVAQMRQLADSKTVFEDRLHSAKVDALKEFAYGAGHELNNPLANIATRAQTLLKDEAHPERRRRLAEINSQA